MSIMHYRGASYIAGAGMKANVQHWFVVLLKLAVAAAILTLFARQIDLHSAAHALSTISPYAVFAASITVLVISLAAAGRLVMVVACFGPRFRLADSWRVTLESMFFSQTFVSFLGGDALRIWRIRELGLALPRATSAVILDRLIGTLVNHVFLLATLPWLLSSEANSSVKVAVIVLAALGVAGFVLIPLLGHLRGRVSVIERLPARVRDELVTTSAVGRDLFTAHYHRLIWIFMLSSLTTIANMLMFTLILTGMGARFSSAAACAMLVPAVIEISMLPISLAGWGLREGAAIVAFGALGLPADQALGASIAFGLIVAGVSMLGGVLWLVDRRQITQLPRDSRSSSSVPPVQDSDAVAGAKVGRRD
jgi:uncharacterized membrane protein YbhN (UPF0104 family)